MENREKAVLVREDPGPVKIGTLCSDCTNPEEKVMQSYVFDLGNIIRLGMYEKARMSAEVLCEQGGDPVEIARETVFPAVREVLDRYEKGEVNKAHAVKSLEAAEVAENVFRRERKDWDEAALRPGAAVVAAAGEKVSWERKLLETSLECCGFRAERMEPLSAAFGGTSPQRGEARTSCEQSDPGSPLGESCPRSGLRGGEAKVVFVEVTPEAFSQTRDWLEIFRREHPVSSVILFGKYEKLIDRLKIDSDLYCKDPVFGGKIIGE